MEYTDNVIKFPAKSKQRVPESDEEIVTNVNMIKHNHINETLAACIPQLFTNMELAGFSLSLDDDEEDDDINIKDGALIVESIRSLLCKLHGLSHPFQDLSENMFKHDDEEGGLKMVSKLAIVLDKKGDSAS